MTEAAFFYVPSLAYHAPVSIDHDRPPESAGSQAVHFEPHSLNAVISSARIVKNG
jgi:hypothetical protein